VNMTMCGSRNGHVPVAVEAGPAKLGGEYAPKPGRAGDINDTIRL